MTALRRGRRSTFERPVLGHAEQARRKHAKTIRCEQENDDGSAATRTIEMPIPIRLFHVDPRRDFYGRRAIIALLSKHLRMAAEPLVKLLAACEPTVRRSQSPDVHRKRNHHCDTASNVPSIELVKLTFGNALKPSTRGCDWMCERV